MADYYSPITGMHYQDKDFGKAMEQKYLTDKQLKKLEEIKQNNQSQQNTQYDNEGAKIIAEAIKQAKEDRYENELDIESRRQEYERELEDSRQDYEERMRQIKMCSDLGMDYDEILQFKAIIDNWNIDILKQCNKLGKEKEKIIFEVKNLSEQKLSYKTRKEIDELKEKLKSLEEQYKEGKEELEEWIEIENRYKETLNNKSSKSKRSLLMKIFGATPKEKEVNNTYEEGWELTETRETVEKLKNEIKKVNTKIKELENIYEEQAIQDTDLQNKIDVIWKRFLEIEEQLLVELHKENEKYKSVRYGHKEFNEFRKNHYNTDVERLLRRLDFNYFDIEKWSSKVAESRFDTIPQEEVINNGTVEDYLNFIDNVLNA